MRPLHPRALRAHRLFTYPALYARSRFHKVDIIARIRSRPFSSTLSAMAGTEAIIAELYSASVQPREPSSPSPDHAASKSHHAKDGKGFVNPWDSWRDMQFFPTLSAIAQNRFKNGLTGPATNPPSVPVVKPQFPPTRSASTELRATWLGHACYYVEFPGGLRLLCDPVFSQRCSPVQFMGPKRYSKMPCDIADIPLIDVVVISHNHYDHLDYNTILKLKQHHPNVWFFVPLGNKIWFEQMGIHNCTELDWWDEHGLVLTPSDSAAEKGTSGSDGHSIKSETQPAKEGLKAKNITATIGCLPCQHTANRGLRDRGATLWCSWSVEAGGKKLYFGGDTGYRAVPRLPDDADDYAEEYSHLPVCPAFKEIGEYRGPFDLGLIPIGAYNPRWIMSPMHANPYDSVNIFLETKCKKALGMHWGTWVLTDEPILEPPALLKKALAKKGIDEVGVFDVLDIGASKTF